MCRAAPIPLARPCCAAGLAEIESQTSTVVFAPASVVAPPISTRLVAFGHNHHPRATHFLPSQAAPTHSLTHSLTCKSDYRQLPQLATVALAPPLPPRASSNPIIHHTAALSQMSASHNVAASPRPPPTAPPLSPSLRRTRFRFCDDLAVLCMSPLRSRNHATARTHVTQPPARTWTGKWPGFGEAPMPSPPTHGEGSDFR